MNTSKQYLNSIGFSDADQVKDFGYNISYCHYLKRITDDKKHQYVSVISYEGNVREVVLEEYLAEKNTRKPKGNIAKADAEKRGFDPVRLAIFRTTTHLKEVLK